MVIFAVTSFLNGPIGFLTTLNLGVCLTGGFCLEGTVVGMCGVPLGNTSRSASFKFT